MTALPPIDTRAPIGILDSGVGGLTVARAVMELLPLESIRYVGDTANAPYGPRPPAEIRELVGPIIDALVNFGCKAIVIACNSAAAVGAADLARSRHRVPVFDVIAPAARAAVAATQEPRRIGVIATEATVASGAYLKAFDPWRQERSPVQVDQQACPSFVDFIERGIVSGRQVTGLAQAYLDPLQRAGVRAVILGCTHYPLIAPVISAVMGPQVALVSSAMAVAVEVAAQIAATGLATTSTEPPEHRFFSTGPPEPFAALAERFLGRAVPVERASVGS